jgi:tetratricopeptide (TPR) repeat protein
VASEAVSVDLLGPSPQQSAEAYREVGKEHYNEGRYREAAAAFERALKLDPDLLQARVNLAVALHAGLGRSEAAAALLEEALRREPSRVDAHFLLGKVYLALDRVDRAIPTLRRTVDLSATSWEAHYWLGLAYMRADSLKAAAVSFGSASRWGPWMPGPHLSLGHLQDRLGRRLEARAEYEVFQRLRQIERRVELYRGKLKSDPKDLAATEALGLAYLEQGRLQEAASRFQQTIRLDPGYGRGYCGLAQVLAAGGNWPAAVEAYGRASRVQPDLLMAWTGLGAASYRIGQREEAIAAYERALALDANAPDALASLGEVYSALERHEEAIDVWSRLLLLNPQYPQAGTWIARSREHLAGE